MSKFLMVVLSVALLGLGSAGVAFRGWQETHPGDTAPDLTKHSTAEIVASTYVWITGGAVKDIPSLAEQISDQTPAMPRFDFSKIDLNKTVGDVVAWVSGATASAPALAPVAVKPVAPPPIAAAPVPAKEAKGTTTVSAPAAAPDANEAKLAAPVPGTVVAPAAVPVAVRASQTPDAAPVAAAAPTRQADAAAGPQVLSTGSSWTVKQKGCAIGGVTGAGAALVLGPGQVAAFTTGAAAALPATARLVGTVIVGAVVSGCAVGTVLAPMLGR